MYHGQNISRKCNVRDSIPLLFTPPKVKDRQIKRIKENKRLIEDKVSNDDFLNDQVEDFSRVADGTLENKDTEDEAAATTSESPRAIIIELVHQKTEGPQLEKLSKEEASIKEFVAVHEEPTSGNNELETEGPQLEKLSKEEASIKEYVAVHEEPTNGNNELETEGPQLEKLSKEEASIKEYVAVHEEPTSGNNELETEGPQLEKLSNEEASIKEYVAVHEEPTNGNNELETEGPQLEKLSNEEASIKEYVAVYEEPTSGNNELECCSINTLPIVKLPVLLAIQDIEIDILHAVELPVPLEKIKKVEWTVQSLDVQVHPPSTKALLKGELTANIEFLQDNEAYSFHDLILEIPLDKVMEVHWLYPPELSNIQQKEYLFKGKDPLHTQSHYERIQKFTDPLYYNLKHLSFVWHQDVLFENQTQMIQFQGTVTLSIHLFQNQLINLNTKQPSFRF